MLCFGKGIVMQKLIQKAFFRLKIVLKQEGNVVLRKD
jgi:hypothetical protein